jgi:hypothetical protein
MTPPDSSLDEDVDDCVHRHIVFTNHLAADGPNEFSISTPRRGLNAHLPVRNTPPVEAVDGTIMEGGCPMSRRIIEDTNSFLVAI